MRRIAAVAGVDQALVAHYFGSKRALFTRVLGEDGAWAPGLRPRSGAHAARDSEAGERLVVAFLERWDNEAGPSTFGTLLRAAGSDGAAERLLGETIVPLVSGAVSARDLPKLRAALVAAQLLGLAWLRYVERRPPLASASPRLVGRIYGRSVTASLTGRESESG